MELGLLLFTKNELIENAVSALAPYTREILVIDFNSSPNTAKINKDILSKYGGNLLEVVDVGYIEIYRTFAFEMMQSEFIINLDPDETPSESFLKCLETLGDSDIYYVPRMVINTNYVEYLPRIFKNKEVIWGGYIHERPTTKSHKVRYLPKTEFLIHSINEENWDIENSRNRLFSIEACIRPPILHSFVNAYNLRIPLLIRKIFSAELMGRSTNYIPIKLVLFLLLAREKIITPLSFHFSLFYYRYNIKKIKYFRGLSKNVRKKLIESYFEMFKSKGPIKYLGFDLPDYIFKLSHSTYDCEGVSLLLALILFKHNNKRNFDPDNDTLVCTTLEVMSYSNSSDFRI